MTTGDAAAAADHFDPGRVWTPVTRLMEEVPARRADGAGGLDALAASSMVQGGHRGDGAEWSGFDGRQQKPSTKESRMVRNGIAIAAAGTILWLGASAFAEERVAENGIVDVASSRPVGESLDRLEVVVKAKGITVFARIDHSGEAAKVGLQMRPAMLLIFGNPKAGTPLMIASPSVALDLPLKVLAWEDQKGKVWLSYNSAAYLQKRHGLKDEQAKSLSAIAGLVGQAAAP
jgi:uncharacterized protein (DUF302 family)